MQRKVSGGLDETYAAHGSKVAMCSRMMDFLLYCGISRDDFNSIRNQLWKRNTRAVHIAVMLAGGIGALLLLINLIMRSSVIFPYLFLVCGSAAVSGLIELIRRKNAVNLNTIDRAALNAIMPGLIVTLVSRLTQSWHRKNEGYDNNGRHRNACDSSGS